MATNTTITDDRESGGSYPDGLYGQRVHGDLVPSLADIGAPEIERYRRDGFLAVRSAFSADQVDEALAGLSALLANPGDAGIQFEAWAAAQLDRLDGDARLDAVRKFMSFVDYEPRLHALAYDERLLAVVRTLTGSDEIRMFQDMALLKPPGGGREKPWHQDNAFFAVRPGTPIVGVWVALDEARVDNGCMHVIPGSHLEGPVVHFRRRDWQICDVDVQTWRDVAVPLPPGGVLFFDGLMHHGTPANRTRLRRRAVQFHYRPVSVEELTQDERLAIFGSEGKNITC